MIRIQNYIDGKLIDPETGKFLNNPNPANNDHYSEVPLSGDKDAEAAIKAAKKAFPAWSKLPIAKRASILRKLAGLIKENLEELAIAESRDTGKPITNSKGLEIPRAATNFEFFSDMATQHKTETFDMDRQAINYTLRKPLGVVVSISPWNLPLYLLTWKVAPALIFGNTVVAKPSEVTPMTAYLLSKLCIEAGLPPGVLNILHGKGGDLGETLATHPDVKAVTFTGSSATGKIVAGYTTPHLKKLSLEMGGKNPNIIFADCDFDKAIAGTLRSSFANQGQVCLCGSRVFIERPLYEKFKQALIEETRKLIQGDPLDEKTQQGSLVSKEHFNKVLSWIAKAKDEGGEVLIGGEPSQLTGEFKDGNFIQPTIIEGLDPECQTNQEEIFGPVITLIPFDSEDEVIAWANSTRYGLSGSVWTKDIDRGHRIAREVDAGVFWINSWMLRDLRIPFGGVKSSGFGREGGEESYRFFTQVKSVCFTVGENNE